MLMNEFEALTCSVKAKKLNKLERRRRGDLTESRGHTVSTKQNNGIAGNAQRTLQHNT